MTTATAAPLARTKRRIDFDRLNHILIPKTKERRERWRRGRAARLAAPLFALYMRLSPIGRAVTGMALVSSLFALEARRTDSFVLWAALSALVVASLLMGRFARIRNVRLRVACAERVTVGDEVSFVIRAHNDEARIVESLVFTGPFLPWNGVWTLSRAGIAQLAPNTHADVTLRARFRTRGEPYLGRFHGASLLPLGIAFGPAVWLEAPRFMVVPKCANVLLSPIRTRPKRAREASTYTQRVGDSRNFLGVRPYAPGDALRDLHARTWARTGTPIVRQYEHEDTAQVGIVLDAHVPASKDDVFESAIDVAAGIARALAKESTRLSFVSAGSKVLRLGPHTPIQSTEGLGRVLDLLALVEPSDPLAGSALFTGSAELVSEASLVFVVVLAWTPAHEEIVRWLERAGAEVRVVLVTEGESSTGLPPFVHSASASDVRGGKAVVL